MPLMPLTPVSPMPHAASPIRFIRFIRRAALRLRELCAALAFSAFCAAVALSVAGCAGMFGADAPRVSVAGIEPLAGQGFEMRFTLKLRIQNPNDTAISFDGVSLDLELNGQQFASGVGNQAGTVERFSETVIAVPLTVPALAAVRQAFAVGGAAQSGEMPYVLRGKLGGGLTGTTRFTHQGNLSLPSLGAAAR